MVQTLHRCLEKWCFRSLMHSSRPNQIVLIHVFWGRTPALYIALVLTFVSKTNAVHMNEPTATSTWFMVEIPSAIECLVFSFYSHKILFSCQMTDILPCCASLSLMLSREKKRESHAQPQAKAQLCHDIWVIYSGDKDSNKNRYHYEVDKVHMKPIINLIRKLYGCCHNILFK